MLCFHTLEALVPTLEAVEALALAEVFARPFVFHFLHEVLSRHRGFDFRGVACASQVVEVLSCLAFIGSVLAQICFGGREVGLGGTECLRHIVRAGVPVRRILEKVLVAGELEEQPGGL